MIQMITHCVTIYSLLHWWTVYRWMYMTTCAKYSVFARTSTEDAAHEAGLMCKTSHYTICARHAMLEAIYQVSSPLIGMPFCHIFRPWRETWRSLWYWYFAALLLVRMTYLALKWLFDFTASEESKDKGSEASDNVQALFAHKSKGKGYHCANSTLVIGSLVGTPDDLERIRELVSFGGISGKGSLLTEEEGRLVAKGQ